MAYSLLVACAEDSGTSPFVPGAGAAADGGATSSMQPNVNAPPGTSPSSSPMTGGEMSPAPITNLDGGLVSVGDGGSASQTDASSSSDAAVTASCTGKPGMRKGKSNQTLMAGGLKRSFIYYAPEGLDPNVPVPLVIAPHGTNMSGAGMYDLTEYWKIADREKFIVIFPDGEDGPGSLVPWNVGQGICGLGALVGASGNDLAFMDELIKFAQADQCIDEQHIFMTGFSMGGYFSNENGCMNPKIRAIGPHSGGTHDFGKCVNKRKPAIVFHYKGDSLIDYACGVGAKDNWVKLNGCNPSNPDVVKVKNGQCEYYKGCPADGQVALCSFDTGDGALPPGHCWAGGKDQGDNAFAACPDDENAAELGWAFFKKYAW